MKIILRDKYDWHPYKVAITTKEKCEIMQEKVSKIINEKMRDDFNIIILKSDDYDRLWN